MNKVATPVAAAARRMGRFELQRVLGRGAQAAVWLAVDPRLQREVAIKIIDDAAEVSAVVEWLDEARAVSQLSHPGIVPVFEADQADGRSFLVFERVHGDTLSQRLTRGAIPEREAATLMHQVLDAVAFAHERGIVHRDLKPSNILIDENGRARVMDFGIAARISAGHDGRIVGTPSYISPEAANGRAPTPSMDVYAAGLMLGYMLIGTKMRSDMEAMAALRRTIEQDVSWPAHAPAGIDPVLRNIVMHAVARDPAARYESAQAMRKALADWLQLDNEPLPAVSNGTLEFLLRRMRHRTDFPALSDSVARVHRITQSEQESVHVLAAEIQKDVALTQKLLRVVNSAHYKQSADGGITTVSRAASLVGFAGIRNMAFSAVLLEHMPDKTQGQRLREVFLQALLTATLAEAMAPSAREQEESFLCGMFSQLGRLLTEYYLPEEAQQIRQRCTDQVTPDGVASQQAQVSAQVLGLSFEDLGVGVAAAWGLPDALKRSMSRPDGNPPTRVIDQATERMRWRVRAADDLMHCLIDADPAQAAAQVKAVAERYARALNCRAGDISNAVDVARTQMTRLVQGLNLKLPKREANRLLLAEPTGSATVAQAGAGNGIEELPAAAATTDAVLTGPVPREQAAASLTAGIASITHQLAADSFKLNDVLQLILSTMHRSMSFRSVVFCLRDPKSGLLTGRFGLGEPVVGYSRAFRIDVAARPVADLFAAACVRGADMLIAEAGIPSVQERLPAWYRKTAPAGFLLLPMLMKGAPFAMIYADVSGTEPLVLPERELALLRTLRDQAVMAFKTAG